jgi:hypothetical protein
MLVATALFVLANMAYLCAVVNCSDVGGEYDVVGCALVGWVGVGGEEER